MIRLAMIGAGRIAQMHARNIARLDDARLALVSDPVAGNAAEVAAITGAAARPTADFLDDPTIDGIIIARSTETHVPLLRQLADKGKAILCEKPISLNHAEAVDCVDLLNRSGARVMMGFHRRHDVNIRRLHAQISDGTAGRVHQIVISSRSQAPHPIHYLRTSGGLFRDQSIHDFDVAGWLAGEPMRSVYAVGGALVDPEIATAGDIDSAMTTMVTRSGRLVQINNSRFNAFGYDQRIEVYGTLATLAVGNATMDQVSVATASGIRGPTPVPTFLERYAPAFEAEMRAFVRFAGGEGHAACDHNGALAAQRLADAAFESLAAGRPVLV